MPARFCGPPASGNGGWTAGALAALLPGTGTGPVTVSLRHPPPLDVPMEVRRDAGADGGPVSLHHGEALVATATPDPGAVLGPVPPVGPEEARAAAASYAGLAHHPFGSCYSCGTAREPGDGLRIFPGPAGPGLTAAPWTPGGDADAGTTWAAIDCAGAWAADVDERAIVLGRMTAHVLAAPEPGVEHVVVGQVRGEDGRKVRTAASLYDAAGGLVATAEHLWITVDAAAFAAGPATDPR